VDNDKNAKAKARRKQLIGLKEVKFWLLKELKHEDLFSIKADLGSLNNVVTDGSYLWRMPSERKVFHMFYVLFGQYFVYDVFGKDFRVKMGWLACIKAISETNGRLLPSPVLFSNDGGHGVLKTPPQQSTGGDEGDDNEFIVSELTHP
jgi:hypothetical protein